MKEERIKFTTTLIPLNVMNLNKRIYLDNDNLRKNIEDFNVKSKLLGGKDGFVYGEYGYPENGAFDTSLSKVSHTISNIRIEDDKVVGDISIVGTPFGNKLKNTYEDMVFRPRSAGHVNHDGTILINKIFTFDAINKNDDAFNMEMIELEAIRNQEKEKADNLLYERIYSDIDPYGEEKWEKE